ncbi:unnamed protein product [Albugo candida]|uniref:subtilisin n=1 Tax=Albugo candida TaxID=65357 RepID=A0A024G1Q8_9STRA|nr:unnamed protein product [Albugo candida]|eukprot:CCI40778.1 unnamed protein product [Albugo candida]
MGTAVGRFGIGVAPNAIWITARAFDIFGTVLKSDFLIAAQWVICPTKLDGTEPDYTLGADIVTNSFAGVVAVFASGNTNGFQCGSVQFPVSAHESITVGAFVGSKTLWGASGKGPGDEKLCSQQQLMKPILAPGVGIRSAISTSDDAHTRLTGTSMATPHTTGLIALLMSLIQSYPTHFTFVYDTQYIITVLKNTSTQTFSRLFLSGPSVGISAIVITRTIFTAGACPICNAANLLGSNCSIETLAVKPIQ